MQHLIKQNEEIDMAYMNQEEKAKIAAMLKKIMPKNWKYSLSVENNSGIRLTISSAPIDLIEMAINNKKTMFNEKPKDLQVHDFRLESYFSGEVLEIFEKIKQALNLNNYNNSDVMTDYYEVGHYVYINLGRWNKPFLVK